MNAMAQVPFSRALADEYQRLFDACQIRGEKADGVATIVGKLQAQRQRYAAVGDPLGIPWSCLAVIHAMEASLSFSTHLHNGDPLSGRTVQVPAGRPKWGMPPFTWEESATDALRYAGLDKWRDWSLPGLLYVIEKYNGWGYRLYHPHVLTPYLWGGSHHYHSGKYVADGRWSDTAVSAQLGAAVLLRRMAELGIVCFGPEKSDSASESSGPVLRYAPGEESSAARSLQTFLNTLPGIFVKVDGIAGEKTSAAFNVATGYYLHGDPRALSKG